MRQLLRASLAWLFIVAAMSVVVKSDVRAQGPKQSTVLIVIGPSTHPPGTHEVAAGARLMQYCVEHVENVPPAKAVVADTWTAAQEHLDQASTIVFIGDIFPPERMENPEQIKRQIAKRMAAGGGMVCVHYATGLRGEHVADDGDHPLLAWLGGYFATGGCEHHRSVARVVRSTITPAETEHPLVHGWKSFTFDDEPYWNNYFGKDGVTANVTPIAYAMVPPDAPKKEIVAWATQRQDGGRGVGVVYPHYFQNWEMDDVRTLVLNSIYWSAQVPIPPEGVKTTLPDLAQFKPESVAPQPREK